MRDTAQSVQDAFFHLQITIDLIEYSKRAVEQKRPDVQEELNKMWLTWSLAELDMGERETLMKSQPMESRILLVFSNIIQRLRTACLALHFNTQGFPGHVQERVYQLESIVDYVQAFTCTAASFQDFACIMLVHTKLKILKARVLLHDLLDYVTENITLTWLAKPLASPKGLAESTTVNQEINQSSSHQSK
uniref:Uncharacterized protein n=1 Tax=Sphaerodactylus townsendi TaxID=933632 RepID=A0ACB8ESK6_9SAUR